MATTEKIAAMQQAFNEKFGCALDVEKMLASYERYQRLQNFVDRAAPPWNRLYVETLANAMKQYAHGRAEGKELPESVSVGDLIKDFEAIMSEVREERPDDFAQVHGGMTESQLDDMKVMAMENAPSRSDIILEQYQGGTNSLRAMREKAAALTPQSDRAAAREVAASMIAIQKAQSSRSFLWRMFHPIRNRAEKRDMEMMRGALLRHLNISERSALSNITLLKPFGDLIDETEMHNGEVTKEIDALKAERNDHKRADWLKRVGEEEKRDGVMPKEELEKARTALAGENAKDRPALIRNDERSMRELERKLGLLAIECGRKDVDGNKAMISNFSLNIETFAQSFGATGSAESFRMCANTIFVSLMKVYMQYSAEEKGTPDIKLCIENAQKATALMLKAFTPIYEKCPLEDVKKLAFGGLSKQELYGIIKEGDKALNEKLEKIRCESRIEDDRLSRNPDKLDAKKVDELRAATRESMKNQARELNEEHLKQVTGYIEQVMEGYDFEADFNRPLDYYPSVPSEKTGSERRQISVDIGEKKNEKIELPVKSGNAPSLENAKTT